ncbi:MAG: AIPR family protein [Erysipelotrichaceae bacterium]|nr:AIPR family protein [Erysipelotrichaceae bacterium]
MNIWQLKEFFDEKIAHMPPSDEMEELDAPHVFLKFALSSDPDCSDPIIGHFEMANRGIKYDGYYLNEDEKEFHVFSLIYFEDFDSLNEAEIRRAFNEAESGAIRFAETAMKGKSNITTDSEVGEHVQELIDCLSNGYSIIFDFYSNVALPSQSIPTSIIVGKMECRVDIHDANSIYERIKEDETGSLIIELKKQYGEPLTALRVARNESFDVYMTAISGPLLSRIYDDHKNRLMDGNVRAYLKRTQKTNKKISETLHDAPQDFIALNNGLAAVASMEGSEIVPLGDGVYLINALDKMQIVNGGQTTVTIYEIYRDGIDLSEVMVPVKLTVLKRQNEEASLVTNIAISANTQTAIAKSDLASNRPFYKSLEALSLHTPCYRTAAHSPDEAYYWFFERSNGLYNTRKRIIWNYSNKFTRLYPEKKKFSKKILAKAIMAYAVQPDIVCQGNEKCFQVFNDRIEKNQVMPDSRYYRNVIGALIIWREADKIIARSKLPIKAAVLPYTISYICEKVKGLLDLERIFEEQTIDQPLKTIIDGVSRMISSYFISVQEEFPNTLMYGRKKECWETVKNLHFPVSTCGLQLGTKPIDFFPQNPALTFIQDSGNLNKVSLWESLLEWNENAHVFSKTDVDRIRNDIIIGIRVQTRILMDKDRKFAINCFIKAVQNGYFYR